MLGSALLSLQVGYGAPATGPLRASRQNPRYFADPTGKIIYLAGSQTGGWDIQDDAWSGYAAPGTRVRLDFHRYLDHLTTQKHNLIRLWSVETTRFDKGPPEMVATPMQFLRTGPGNALDGRPRFDLTRYDPAYFSRLRSAVAAACDRGIYVMTMLFEGFSSVHPVGPGYVNPGANPWIGHPFNAKNNINGIDADVNGDGMGLEYHSLASPETVALQKAYVRKVVDTLNDLNNVIYEIANESVPASRDWQYEMIRTIKQYESTRPKQHPVVMSYYWPGDSTQALFDSPADAVAPGYRHDDPPPANGSKVVLLDQDHNDWKSRDPRFVWKSFLRGNNVIIFDQDVVPFDWERGVVSSDDKSHVPIRRAVRHTRSYAGRMKLAEMTPQDDLASTGYCLAKSGSEYLVYQPNSGRFSVTLDAGKYTYEWFNPSSGTVAGKGKVTTKAGSRDFTPPFDGQAVLYLKGS